MIQTDWHYPMKQQPAFKDYIWGGTRLKAVFGKPSPFERTAESWELSCHKDGPSTIGNGPLKGMTLSAFLGETGPAPLGTQGAKFERFPVLVKLIDANDNLSVQVHPDDTYALSHEGEYGKTEMWYVVDCEPGARLYHGFKKEISKEEFRRRIGDNTLPEVLNAVPVHKGDVFMIPSGTVHAIGKGMVIAEIQQNSNTTYRIWDYGRLGKDGKPRELHIEKALDVAVTGPFRGEEAPRPAARHDGFSLRRLKSCPYFTVDLLALGFSAALTAGPDSFFSLTCTEGAAWLSSSADTVKLALGDTVFVPADTGVCTLEGSGTLLMTYLGERSPAGDLLA